METVLVAFKGPQNYHLLIVDCEIISAEQCRHELWDSLHDIMTEYTDKKMILIIQGTDKSKINFKNSCTVLPENNNDYNINSLEKYSQQKLLKRKVKFQGKEEYFGRLFGIDVDNIDSEKLTDLGRIINPKILVQLIKNEEIIIGADITGLSEIKSYYIPRRIDRHVVIKEDILKASGIEDLLAIGGSDRASLTRLIGNETVLRSFNDSSQIDSQRRICFVLDHDREAHQFKDLCRQNADLNIHWLQCVSGKLIWIRSHGNVSNLLEYKDTTQGNHDEKKNEAQDDKDQLGATSLDEDDFAAFDKQRRIVILSDIAGMGKTTILTHLAQKMKDKQPSSLVITITLRLYTTVLEKEVKNRTFDSNNTDGAVDFLVDNLGGLGTGLEREVYKKILNGDGEAALLFDGFDEISLTHGHIVVQLLQALVKKISIKKIIVTTRPHTSKVLEKKLEIFSYSLQPFSPNNQRDFLKKFWKQGLSENYSDEALEERSELRAERVIQLLENSVYHTVMDFTSVPLQTMMLAHIYRYRRIDEGDTSDETDERIALKDIEAEMPEKIDIIYSYGKFVHEKFNILLTEKQSGDSTNQYVMRSHESDCNMSSMQHQKFALEELFEKQIVNMLLTSQPEVEFCIARSGKSISDAEQIGLVTPDVEGKPQFIHRTFAEYFAATFLIDILKDDSRNQQVRNFFVAELFLKPQYKTIPAFLDCLFLRKTEPVKNESWKLDLRKHRDKRGWTVYHLAAVERNIGIIQFFLGPEISVKIDYLNCEDQIGWTPLHLAVTRPNNFKLVEYLCKSGADIDRQDQCGLTSLHCAVTCPGNLAVVKYLCDRITDINCKDEHMWTPLHVAVTRPWNLLVVKYLCKKGADISLQDQDLMTPLRVAVINRNLAIVKYLIDGIADIHCKKQYGGTLLHLAVLLYNDVELVECLCQGGADINCKDQYGLTPLHGAVIVPGKLAVVRYLCDNGANLNCEGMLKQTPLHVAVASPDNFEVVRYLCDNGANVNCQNIYGASPLDGAVQSNNLAIVRYLRSKAGA